MNSGKKAEQSNGVWNAMFCVSASFSLDSVVFFAPVKCKHPQLENGLKIYKILARGVDILSVSSKLDVTTTR